MTMINGIVYQWMPTWEDEMSGTKEGKIIHEWPDADQ